jgi:hypothetical protein
MEFPLVFAHARREARQGILALGDRRGRAWVRMPPGTIIAHNTAQ